MDQSSTLLSAVSACSSSPCRATAADEADLQLAAVRFTKSYGGKRVLAATAAVLPADELASVGSVVFHVVAEIVGMPLPFGNRRSGVGTKNIAGKFTRSLGGIRDEGTVLA